MAAVEIRPVCPEDDRLAISHVYEASWRHAYRGIIPQSYLDALPRGRWAGLPDLEGHHSLVALDGERIVGTACYCPARMEQWSGWGEIVSLYLLPTHMGKGYGRALLATAVAALHALGYHSIFLWVLEDNHPARGFYQHMGFQPTGRHRDETVGGARLRNLQYRLTAPPTTLS